MSNAYPPPYGGPQPAGPAAGPPTPPGYAGPTPGYAGPMGYAAPPGGRAPDASSTTLAIASVVLSVLFPPAGLVLSIGELRRSRRGQQQRTLAIVALVLSVVLVVPFVFGCILAFQWLQFFGALMGNLGSEAVG